MIAVAESVGANRIFPAASIVYPLGNPVLQRDKEREFRVSLVKKALNMLTE